MATIFPTGMRGAASDGRPFIYFKEKEDGNEIFLPLPAGVTFGDSGSYSTINMGMIGAFTGDNEGNTSDAWNKAAKSFKDGEITKLAKRFGAGFFLQNDGAEKYMAATKRILNPNTNTTFEGNSIRTFQFEFTLVGRSKADTDAIREVHNTFRKYAYPESTEDSANVILDYPPVWEIKFYDGANAMQENKFLPKIHESYLMTLTTNFNPSALMFRTDYSPVEVTMSLVFQETRALMRTDIEKLKAG